MALFRKKKEETETPVCACQCDAQTATVEKGEAGAACCPEAEGKICCVKVLGAGCATCHALYKDAEAAVKAMGLELTVEYITDMQRVTAYGVMSFPALVVNEKVVSTGKLLKAAEVESLLRKLMQ